MWVFLAITTNLPHEASVAHLLESCGDTKQNGESQGEKMNLKQQEEQLKKLQHRIGDLTDEMRVMQHEIKVFKETVARDMQRAFKQLQNS